MRYPSMICFLFSLLTTGFVTQGASNPPAKPPQSPVKIRKEAYFSKHLVDAYEKVGRHNPKWDADARALLKLAVYRWVNTPVYGVTLITNDMAINHDLDWQIMTLADRAIRAGCDDPAVLYHDLCAHVTMGGQLPPGLLAMLEQEMPSSRYAPFLKVYAMGDLIRIATKGLGEYTSNRQPDRMRRMVQCFYANIAAMAADRELPPAYAAEYCCFLTEFDLSIYEGKSKKRRVATTDRKPKIDKIYNIMAKAAPNSPTPDLFKGLAYHEYAWDARGGPYGDDDSDEAWRQYEERLKVARASLNSALRIDPHCAEASAEMIGTSEGGQDMESYFQRAIKEDPDCYLAYRNKLHRLSGVQNRIEFEKVCLASQRWDSRIPFLVLRSHKYIVQPPNCLVAYLSYMDNKGLAQLHKDNPAAWQDLQALYEGYTAYNPNSVWDRNLFIGFAARTMHTEIAQRQADQLKQVASDPAWAGMARPYLDNWMCRIETPSQRVLDWLTTNKSQAPKADFIKDLAATIKQYIAAEQDVSFLFGSGYFKSKKVTLLDMRAGQMFTFEYSDQDAKTIGLSPMQMTGISLTDGGWRSNPLEAKVLKVTLDGNEPYDATKPITGEVTYQIPKPISADKGDLCHAVHLQYNQGPLPKGGHLTGGYDYFRENELDPRNHVPRTGIGKHRFTFPLGGATFTGPLVLYFDLARNNGNIISNTVGIKVQVIAPPVPAKPAPKTPAMKN